MTVPDLQSSPVTPATLYLSWEGQNWSLNSGQTTWPPIPTLVVGKELRLKQALKGCLLSGVDADTSLCV
jgi:hypothetical protein